MDDEFDRQLYFENNKFIPLRLAREICYSELGVTRGLFVVTSDNQEIWYFNGSYYESTGEKVIKSMVQDKMGEGCTTYMKKEVVSFIKDDSDLWISREEFDSYKHLINLQNGIYNIETGDFIEHNSGYLFTNEIPITYDPDAKINKIEQFLKDVLYPEDIPMIQELFGYCFYKDYKIHKAFIFVGDGANGKSTLLRLLEELLGKQNVSTVPLQTLGKDKFASYDLYGKLANICADIPNTALTNTGMFKMITGGDYIRGEKKFGDPFKFLNYAKLIFSANQLPKVPTDQSDAFFRRWIPIIFPNRFIGSNCDKNILLKLTTEEEMSGLFNWNMEGLKRLLEQQEFSQSKSIEQVREYWNKSSDIVAEFISDHLEESPDGVITKTETYNRFLKFCREKHYPTIASNIFSQRLKKVASFNIEEGQKHGGKKTWKGVRWKEEGGGQTELAGF